MVADPCRVMFALVPGHENKAGAVALVLTCTYCNGVLYVPVQTVVLVAAAPPAVQLHSLVAVTVNPVTFAAAFEAAFSMPSRLAWFPGMIPKLAPAFAASVTCIASCSCSERLTQPSTIIKKIGRTKAISISALPSSDRRKIIRPVPTGSGMGFPPIWRSSSPKDEGRCRRNIYCSPRILHSL